MLKQALIEDVRNRKVLLLVGAGVSLAATRGDKLASWTGLLANGVERAAHFGAPRPADPKAWIANKQGDLNGDLPDLLGVAEQISSRLGGPDGGEFANWLGATVGRLALADTTVRDALRSWQAPIATTNYDDLLERSVHPGDTPWDFSTQRDDHEVLPILSGAQTARVLHLHGHHRRPETVILGIRDYQAQLGDAFVQAIQRFALMDRTIVFVGFGAGLSDPNFAHLLNWFGATLRSAGIRHYRLCLAAEAAAAVNGVHAVPFGARHEDLAPFLCEIAAAAFPTPSVPAPVPAAPPPSAPLPPARIIGRDAQITALVALLTRPEAANALVLGGPGIGKTTLTRRVATDPALIAAYADRRWFVALETAADADTMARLLVAALGLDPAQAKPDDALRRLAEEPGLLVLDNLETPWESQRAPTEALLARLAAVPGLRLLASLRGRTAPSLRWESRPELAPLNDADSAALLRDIARGIRPDDPDFPKLLAALGGIPLAIELVARQAEPDDSLAAVWHEWQRIGAALAQEPGAAPSRLTSLEVSIRLSVGSPHLCEAGRRLFALLGVSPAGLADADCGALLCKESFAARRGLLATGLGVARDGRLDLLPPVRDVARRTTSLAEADAAAWRQRFLDLTRTLGAKVGRLGGADALRRLVPEIPNIAAALDAAIAAGDLGAPILRLTEDER